MSSLASQVRLDWGEQRFRRGRHRSRTAHFSFFALLIVGRRSAVELGKKKQVFEVEPLPGESPLWDLPNVTEESRDGRVRSAAEWVDRGSLGTTALEAKWPRGICARNFGKR